VEAELFHVDRKAGKQASVTKLIAAFLNFAKAPKNHIKVLSNHIKQKVRIP
jgi:hypothetical protein